MPDYQFSTVKIVPQSARMEPVAVGVILYDPAGGVIYRRFTDNWDEVRRRTGLANLPDIRSVTEEGPIRVGDDYLAALSEGQFPDTLFVTPPNSLMPFDTPDDALEWTFGMHVGLLQRAGADGLSGRRADELLAERIAAAGFAAGSYRRRYRFDLHPPYVVFPHVFLKGAVPHDALFAVSVQSESAAGVIKSRICDIASIRKWTSTKAAFRMCAVEARGDDGWKRPAVRSSLALLGKWDIGIVYRDGLDDTLSQIRDEVSSVPIVRP